MPAKDIDLQIYLNLVKAEIDILLTTIRDKGIKRFGKAFGISAVMIFAAYFLVYKPPQRKISRLAREIESARAMASSGAAYRDLRDELAGLYKSLPELKDQQEWLSNSMIDSLRADGMIPETFRPVSEMEAGGLIYQTLTVQLTVKFSDLYAWLTRLEGATPLMHISNLEVARKPERMGFNGVTASVMTAIPKKRFN